ncbi:hypothetical protein [Bacillus nitratireducens]|nr:hypothetical protein [Bacillus nitratireducens]
MGKGSSEKAKAIKQEQKQERVIPVMDKVFVTQPKKVQTSDECKNG